MSAKEAAGNLVMKLLLVALALFILAAFQTGMIQEVWNDLTSKVEIPTVSVDTK